MKIENIYQKEVPNSENVIAQKSYGSDTLWMYNTYTFYLQE